MSRNLLFGDDIRWTPSWSDCCTYQVSMPSCWYFVRQKSSQGHDTADVSLSRHHGHAESHDSRLNRHATFTRSTIFNRKSGLEPFPNYDVVTPRRFIEQSHGCAKMTFKKIFLSAVSASSILSAVSAIAPASLSIATQAQAGTNISVNFGFGSFYDRLQPYGNWVSYQDQYVFVPQHLRRGWRP